MFSCVDKEAVLSGCPSTMKGLLEWISSKVNPDGAEDTNSASSVSGGSKKSGSHAPSIITPRNIPEFVIPPSSKCRTAKSMAAERKAKSESAAPGCFAPIPNMAAGPFSQSTNSLFAADCSVRHVATSPGNLADMISISYPQPYDRHSNDLEYMAAVSLPHLRTVTSYGFPTVSEIPNTRRKESLLLGSRSFGDMKRFNKRKMGTGAMHTPSALCQDVPVFQSPGSPLQSPSSAPLSEIEESDSMEPSTPVTYRRRRSSLSCSSDSTTEGLCMKSISAHSSSDLRSLAPLGEIKFSVLYSPAARQCTIHVVKAENLMPGRKDADCNAFVKVYLLSDGVRKEQTDAVRGTRNPVYNRRFTFNNVASGARVRLRVYHRPGSTVSIGFRCPPLGEVSLDLNGDECRGVSQWRELQEPETTAGQLAMSMEFNPRDEEMRIRIIDANKLFTSSSNSSKGIYVKLSVTQHDRPAASRRTRMAKSCFSWKFDETFAFSVSPRFDDLQMTSISVKVMQKKLRADSVLGALVIGPEYEATGAPETSFWNDTIACPNTVVMKTLELRSYNGD